MPYRSLNSAMSFLNGTDGNGVGEEMDPLQGAPYLVQALDFPNGNGADGVDTNPFLGVAVEPPMTVDNHVASWSGVFNATEAGLHDFWTQSDDASMVFIDGAIVVNNNYQQGIAGSERHGAG